jgi:signal transduction histidine kinase
VTGVTQPASVSSPHRHDSPTAQQLKAENARLRHQLLLLSGLSHRVAASLDWESVLQDVVGAACELTGARYGALAVLTPDGEFQRLLTHGLTEQERERLGELPHGRGVIGLLHETAEALRVDDLVAHDRFFGFPPGHPSMKSFLGTSIHDDGTIQGSLYLADKADGTPFSTEDEELLILFQAQAAAAIRNARQFNEAQSARAAAEAAQLELQRSEAKLREDSSELERVRSNLLGTIAHEFRTPLTAIRTAVGVLQDPDLVVSESQEERFLESISQSATLMQRLVSDLLDISRFKSGRAPLQMTRFDACALARDVVRTVAGLLEARRQRVAIESPSRLWVHGDRALLGRALLNLVSNATNFAPEDSEIGVRVCSVKGDAVWAVTDHGPGIPPASRPFLFERFFTVARSDSAKATGTGLGLPIAMAIAEAHGGTIEVGTEAGQGSTFALRVPAKNRPGTGP